MKVLKNVRLNETIACPANVLIKMTPSLLIFVWIPTYTYLPPKQLPL